MIRLNKYIADTGICTRREADKLIANGDIEVNGQKVKKLGALIRSDAKVAYKGKIILRKQSMYILFNKPSEQQSAVDYLKKIEDQFSQTLQPISCFSDLVSGLILFTNDRQLSQKLSNEKLQIQNKYKLELSKEITTDQLSKLTAFFHSVKVVQNTSSTIFIYSRGLVQENNLFKQFEDLSIEVLSIDRLEYGPLKKGALSRGNARELQLREVGFLKMLKG